MIRKITTKKGETRYDVQVSVNHPTTGKRYFGVDLNSWTRIIGTCKVPRGRVNEEGTTNLYV